MNATGTGVAAIDAMRREMASSPTTPDNAVRRQSLIMAWVRLLVHRGIDLTDVHQAGAAFARWGPVDPSRMRTDGFLYAFL